ncbi:MAG: Rnase Y domain-containing protein, partial [Flavobacteriales bacterium]
MTLTGILIGAIIGLVIGGVAVFIFSKGLLKKEKEGMLKEVKLKQESIKQEKILQAKEKFLALKEKHETSVNDRNRKMQSAEDRIKSKEKQISQKLEQTSKKDKDLERLKKDLESQLEVVTIKRDEISKKHEKQVAELEKLSGYSKEDAKAQLVEALKDEAKTDAMAYIKNIADEAKLSANQEAKKIVIQSIQRVATEKAVENSVSIFNIPSDEVK